MRRILYRPSLALSVCSLSVFKLRLCIFAVHHKQDLYMQSGCMCFHPASRYSFSCSFCGRCAAVCGILGPPALPFRSPVRGRIFLKACDFLSSGHFRQTGPGFPGPVSESGMSTCFPIAAMQAHLMQELLPLV